MQKGVLTMDENTVMTEENQETNVHDKVGGTFSFLPAGVQVLIDWVIFLFATLASYFTKKNS